MVPKLIPVPVGPSVTRAAICGIQIQFILQTTTLGLTPNRLLIDHRPRLWSAGHYSVINNINNIEQSFIYFNYVA